MKGYYKLQAVAFFAVSAVLLCCAFLCSEGTGTVIILICAAVNAVAAAVPLFCRDKAEADVRKNVFLYNDDGKKILSADALTYEAIEGRLSEIADKNGVDIESFSVESCFDENSGLWETASLRPLFLTLFFINIIESGREEMLAKILDLPKEHIDNIESALLTVGADGFVKKIHFYSATFMGEIEPFRDFCRESLCSVKERFTEYVKSNIMSF